MKPAAVESQSERTNEEKHSPRQQHYHQQRWSDKWGAPAPHTDHRSVKASGQLPLHFITPHEVFFSLVISWSNSQLSCAAKLTDVMQTYQRNRVMADMKQWWDVKTNTSTKRRFYARLGIIYILSLMLFFHLWCKGNCEANSIFGLFVDPVARFTVF